MNILKKIVVDIKSAKNIFAGLRNLILQFNESEI